MKRLFLAVMMMSAVACSSTKNTTPVGVATDVVAGTDVKASGDAADGTVAPGDTTSGDDAKADAAKDTATKDAAKDIPPVESDKCTSDDSACISSCAQADCIPEINACLGETKCKGLYDCVVSCSKGVSPPAETTGTTCEDKCVTLGGSEAAATLTDMNVCAIGKCIQCTKGDKVIPYAQCVQACSQSSCADDTSACKADKDCQDILTCVGKCATTDNACQNACVDKGAKAGKDLIAALEKCIKDAAPTCE